MVTTRHWAVVVVGALVLTACTSAVPTPAPVNSSFGPMALYGSAEHPFSIQYPAERTGHPKIQEDYGIPVWRIDSQGEWFVVVVGDTMHGESLSAYVDRVISIDKQSDADHEMVSRGQTRTAQGLPAELIQYTISWSGEPMTVNALIYLQDNKVGFRAAYGVYTPRHEEMKDMIAYSFNTFRSALPNAKN